MSARIRSFTPPLLLLTVWLGAIYWWTAGFSAFTTYSYTLHAAGELPRIAPSIRVTDHHGIVRDTHSFGDRYLLLQFAYLNCSDVCPLSMLTFQLVHDALKAKIPPDSLILMTVSIDPERDTAERLWRMWDQHGRPANWVMAALATPLDDTTHASLEQLGIWASRRGDSDFNHSAAISLIDPRGQVVQVFDGLGDSRKIVAAIEGRLR